MPGQPTFGDTCVVWRVVAGIAPSLVAIAARNSKDSWYLDGVIRCKFGFSLFLDKVVMKHWLRAVTSI